METPDESKDHEFAVTAVYTPARVPLYRGNHLIEALPPSMDDETLLRSLFRMPDFSPEQRAWNTSERMQLLDGLSSFMMPMQQQVQLVHALERMIRAGYVGRQPRTPKFAAINDRLYKLMHAGEAFSQSSLETTVQVSTALIGVSGMGKTTTLKRWCARIPRVIYHPELNFYQVPWLHIELPSDGASIKALATAIFEALERRIPRSNYVKLYTKGRPSEEMMILNAARLMHQHSVGILICDEVQNLTNSPKGAQVLMTQLTSLCNILETPLLFVGTNKATKILGIDFRQARRSVGEGVSPWERLSPRENGGDGEWEDFIATLWKYQWVKEPVPENPVIMRFLYYATQGVLDLTIKLFKSAQSRAMLDGTEKLTLELFESIYEREFKVVHHMLDALRTGKFDLLQSFDDIRPLDFDKHVRRAQLQLATLASPIYSSKPTDKTVKIRLVQSLVSLDIDPKIADEAADHVIQKGSFKDLFDAQAQARDYLSAPKPTRKKAKKTEEPDDPKRFDARQYDYRRAYAHAHADKESIRESLKSLGLVTEVEDFLVL